MNHDASKKHKAEAHMAIKRAQISAKFEQRFGVKPNKVYVSPKEYEFIAWLKSLPPGSKITRIYRKGKVDPEPD